MIRHGMLQSKLGSNLSRKDLKRDSSPIFKKPYESASKRENQKPFDATSLLVSCPILFGSTDNFQQFLQMS